MSCGVGHTQTWLISGTAVTVAYARDYSSGSIPSLGTSISWCSPKETKDKKKRNVKKFEYENKNEKYPFTFFVRTHRF